VSTIDTGRKRSGLLCPFRGVSSSNTMWPEPRSTSYQVASSSIQPFGHSRHGPKLGALPLLRESLGPHQTQRRLGRSLYLQVASSSIQSFGHNKHGPKIGWHEMCHFSGGAGCHKVAWSEAYLRTRWHLSPSSRLATMDVGQKLEVVPLWGGRAGSPSNTMWPRTRPNCVASFILICPTVWPQYTNVTDRTGRTDNGPIA